MLSFRVKSLTSRFVLVVWCRVLYLFLVISATLNQWLFNRLFLICVLQTLLPFYFQLSFKVKNLETQGTWRERLQAWKEILQKDKLAEQLESLKAQYAVEFDMKEVEDSLRKDVVEKVKSNQGNRALWISKRWWRYRPKLPYTYFLQKLDSSEVYLFNPSLPIFLLAIWNTIYTFC